MVGGVSYAAWRGTRVCRVARHPGHPTEVRGRHTNGFGPVHPRSARNAERRATVDGDAALEGNRRRMRQSGMMNFWPGKIRSGFSMLLTLAIFFQLTP